MEKLSQEIVDEIVRLVQHLGPHYDIDNLRHVSGKFLRACERLQYKWETLRGVSPRRLGHFVALYRSFRRPMLRKIIMVLELPQDFLLDGSVRDPDTPDALDELITSQVLALFHALRTLEDEGLLDGKLTVRIANPGKALHIRQPHAGDVSRHIHLTRIQDFPEVRAISRLSTGQGPRYYREDPYLYCTLAPKTPFQLLPKLPNLDAFLSAVDDEHNCNLGLELIRIKERENIAAFLPTLPDLSNLKRATLRFLGDDAHKGLDHASQMPNLKGTAPRDPFSLSLGIFCRHLTQLRLEAVIDENFFWPVGDESVLWPNMEFLEVKFDLVAPSGAWYFQGPGGRGSEIREGYSVVTGTSGEPGLVQHDCTPSQWRFEPVHALMTPFITAYAKSASRMPRLKSALIWSPVHYEPDERDDYLLEAYDDELGMVVGSDIGWGIGYEAPGIHERSGFLDDRVKIRETARQFWWSLSWDHRLATDLRPLFHEIGRSEHGSELDDHVGHFRNQKVEWFIHFWPVGVIDDPESGLGLM